MPVVPNAIERLVMQLGLAPAPMLDIFAAGAFRAAIGAIDLGVFEALRAGPLSAGELAARLHAEPRALGALLALLHRSGYVRRDGDRWSSTDITTKWVAEGSPTGKLFRYWGDVVADLFADLPDTVRRGRTRVHFHEWLSERPERWRRFNEAMADIATIGADEIVARAPLPANARALIDVGGNHAINTIAFCRHYPSLRATVFDLPEAFGDARSRVREAGLAERVTFAPGDFSRDSFGGPFDVALLLNILHYQQEQPNVALLRKTHDALSSGGVAVILEQLPEAAPTPMTRTFLALFDLVCVTALGGGVASFDAIATWLREAGFREVRRIGLRKTPASALIVATRA